MKRTELSFSSPAAHSSDGVSVCGTGSDLIPRTVACRRSPALAWAVLLLLISAVAFAQGQPQAGSQRGSGSPASGASGQAKPAPVVPQTPAPSAGKLPPQAKTQEEYKAYQEASQLVDPVAAEKAADDFAAKFKNSELRYLLYYRAMTLYQNQNNADKAIEMGRKVLQINPDEPITLAMVANFISERVRDTDPDRDLRLAEALADAQKSLQSIDTELIVPPGTPAAKVESDKALLRSIAYAAIGNVYLSKGDYAQAESNLKKSLDLNTVQPDAVTWLRYAVVLDHLSRYPEALQATNKALELSPQGSPQADMAKQEQDRLQKLTGTSTPAPAPKQPAASTEPR